MRKSFLVGLLVVGFTYAQGYDAVKAEMLSLSCMNCHGTNGNSGEIMSRIKSIPKSYLYDTLIDFKTGKRESTVMQKHVKGYTDAELELIAEYFSKFKRTKRKRK